VRDENPRRVAINALFLLPRMGGLVTYLEELMPELVRAAPQTRFTVHCSPLGEAHLRALPWAGEVRLISHPWWGAPGLKALSELTVLGAFASRSADVLHSIALTAPLSTRATNIITIADTTWFAGPRADATTLLWRAIVPPLARRADRLIAISQAGARDITRYLHVPADRIDVTLLGYRPPVADRLLPEAEVRRRFGLGGAPFVLMVGTRKPHKNVAGLLAAFAQLAATDPDVRLVLAGNPTALEPSLLALADELGVRGRVAFAGFVEPAELEGLYAAATCLILPSHNEGFGLPVLEAMGRGVAVACSSVSALPEVGGDAARYFDPTRPQEIAGVLRELLDDPELRTQVGAAGRARAAQLNWRATAEATLESYRRASSTAGADADARRL
jgi:glycosyltransferase involved in cell wall biosynthesis